MSLNLTPMIDVVFLLLFFFLAVSRFQPLEGLLPAQLPTAHASAAIVDVPRTPIQVQLVFDPAAPDDCKVLIKPFQEPPRPVGTLAAALLAIPDLHPGFDQTAPVHLIAADEVAWDHVVNAYNAVIAARYEKIYFVANP